MTDEKDVLAATDLVMSTVERLVGDGFQPDTIISALINVAVATAFHVPDWTSQEANELIRLNVERALAGMTYGGADGDTNH